MMTSQQSARIIGVFFSTYHSQSSRIWPIDATLCQVNYQITYRPSLLWCVDIKYRGTEQSRPILPPNAATSHPLESQRCCFRGIWTMNSDDQS
jgi:hypothetical protein